MAINSNKKLLLADGIQRICDAPSNKQEAFNGFVSISSDLI